MRNKRNLMLREKRIKLLEEQLKAKDDIITALESENKNLKEKIITTNHNAQLIQQQSKIIIDAYREELELLRKSKLEYNSLITEVKKERKQYKNKMETLLSKLKRQN